MKKKFLLVLPPITDDETKWYVFPIGIAYVSASLKKAGFDVSTVNLNYKKNPMDVLEKVIKEKNIDVVGTGGLSTQYPELRDIVSTAKRVNPDIITMVGGGIITGDAEPAMTALEYADYGMLGEGEETICELARYLENPEDYQRSEIDGIIYYENGSYVLTNPRKEIEDLDSIPFPDYDGFEYDKVIVNDSSTYIFSEDVLNTAAICGSRSCVYNCTFCFHSSGKRYRKRSIDNIFKEIDWLISKYPVEQLFIVDELFASNQARLSEFCDRIKDYHLPWIASLRVDIVTKPMLEKLKEANCKAIGFGLESADNSILKSMRKNITIEQIDNALRLCNEVGMLSAGTFIFGDLEETTVTYNNTLNWWKAHPEYYIKLALISVYPGSYLYKVACEKGIIKDKVQFLKDGCPIINVSKLTDAEYAELSGTIDTISSEIDNITLEKAEFTVVDKRVNLAAGCPFCGSEQRWEHIDAFRRMEAKCKNCSRKYQLDIYKYVDLDVCEENVKKLLEKYEKIAIWPRTVSTYNLVNSIKALQDDNVFIVDKSPIKQKSKMLGKRTCPPDVIEEEQIGCVMINIPTNVEGEIEREVLRSYKQVKKIIKAGELLKPLEEI